MSFKPTRSLSVVDNAKAMTQRQLKCGTIRIKLHRDRNGSIVDNGNHLHSPNKRKFNPYRQVSRGINRGFSRSQRRKAKA